MRIFEYCAGIFLLFLTEVALAKEKKGVIDCGHIFDIPVGAIVNNTLHPDTTCTYIINPSASKPTGTHLLLKKLLLDENDNVTISKLNESDPLFPIFHGQSDAVALIGDATAVQITIQTSSVSNIVRHFDLSYDMKSEVCSFVIDDSIPTIQQPLTSNQSAAECVFVFNARPNVARSFSFELFNLTSSSSVKVTGVENPVSAFGGANRPPDLFASGQVKIEVKTNPGDDFLLRQFLLDSACSTYLNVSDAAIQIESPPRPMIDNGSMNLECRWFVQSGGPNIEFTINSIELKSVYDILVITDGPHYNSEPLHQITSSTASETIGKEIVTNEATMVVSFKPDSVLSKFTASVRESSAPQSSSPPTTEMTTTISYENKSKGVIECGHIFKNSTGAVSNNTLHPKTSCSYHISPETGTQPIRLLISKLILDSEDNVTVTKDNDTEPLFPILHGQSDAVILITDLRNITVTIDTSNVPNITRHFQVHFESSAEECTFKIDDDVLTLQQPLLLVNTSEKCKISYNWRPNIERSFSFENFNLSAGSSILADKVENVETIIGQKTPPDIFSYDQATFEISYTPGDHFRLRQHETNRACSGFKKVAVSDSIETAPMPKYDNGSLNLECRWLIVSGSDNSLGLKLKSIELTNPYDVLLILDGPNFDSPPLYEITSLTAEHVKDNVMLTSGSSMMVSFKSSSILSNFSAEVSNAGQSKYYKNSGTLSMKPSSAESTWLLQVEPSQTITLTFNSSSFSSPAVLDIYDDFNVNSKLIASLHGNVWYPILSTTSRMMIVAKGFDKKESFTAVFSGSTVGCMHMSQGSSDTYTLSKNCKTKCAWIIPPIDANDTDLILDLQFISLETGDVIEVLEMDDNKTNIATISAGITHVPQFAIKSDVGAYINITRGSCPKRPDDIVLVAQANYLPKCSGKLTLTPSQEVRLTSPGFPNTYPLLANCRWSISTSPANQLIHFVFTELQLAENHCILLGQNTSTPIILNGSTLPDDLFTTANVLMQFNSVGCDSKIQQKSLTSAQGFAVNITSPDYGQILKGNSGNITINANTTFGMWEVSVPMNSSTEKESVNIIIFTVQPKDKVGNYKLDIYDGATTRDAAMTNITGSEIWSRTNSLIIICKRENISKPSSEILISYTTKSCNKAMQCNNGICLHPDWRCNGVNDCGDFTDEIDCDSVPVPTPTPVPTSAPSTAGVSPTAFGVTIVFMLALGAVLAVITPIVYRKFRNGQYSQFRDVSVIE